MFIWHESIAYHHIVGLRFLQHRSQPYGYHKIAIIPNYFICLYLSDATHSRGPAVVAILVYVSQTDNFNSSLGPL